MFDFGLCECVTAKADHPAIPVQFRQPGGRGGDTTDQTNRVWPFD
jgi:hypothetical protein